MYNRLRILPFALGAIVSAAFTFFSPVPVSAGLVDDIKARQKGIFTVQAGFNQEKHTVLMGRPIRSKGSIYFKFPVGVRWVYDEGMVVIYDGSDLYIHYTELEVAEKMRGVDGYIGPLGFDIEILLRDYDVAAEGSDDEITLQLRPLKEMPFESMRMIFRGDAPFPGEIQVLEEGGDRTVIRFHDILTNAPLSDELFRFTPPPGVKLRERRFAPSPGE
jgi:outer membrane lipoprotein-sorting protein